MCRCLPPSQCQTGQRGPAHRGQHPAPRSPRLGQGDYQQRGRAAKTAKTPATVYKPYGERTPTINLTLAPEDREDKGRTRERFDPETGLQYLNARYYDPQLGLFLQPDWWEVTKPGVGTNRYAYSFNDPVNRMDPGGNAAIYKDIDGDGDNEYYGQVNPGDPGYEAIACGCPGALGGDNPSASDWVDINNAMNAYGEAAQGEGQGTNSTFAARPYSLARYIFPDSSIFRSRVLTTIWSNPGVQANLQAIHTVTLETRLEHGGWIYGTNQEPSFGGIRRGTRTDIRLGGTWGGTPVAHAHSHPGGDHAFYGPSDVDRDSLVADSRLPGFLVEHDGRVIGYGFNGDGLTYSDGRTFH